MLCCNHMHTHVCECVCVCGIILCLFLFIDSFLHGNLQLKWLVDIFRAKIVDISEHSVTIEVIAGLIRI